MKTALRWITFISIVLMTSRAINAQHPSGQSGDHQQSDKGRHDQINHRGDHAMGFSHTKTTHHFRLTTVGGVIEVTANDSADTDSRNQIRQHLKHIAVKFSEGDFSAPMFIHRENPPGVKTMKRLKVDIKYKYQEIDCGAKVLISTNDDEAINAIHEFLLFQIKDHKTGDPIEVQKTANFHTSSKIESAIDNRSTESAL